MSKLKTPTGKTPSVNASRPKLSRVDVKRSAPIDPVMPPNSAMTTGSVLGYALLQQIKRAVAAERLLEENESPIRAERANEAANKLAETLALVPPKGPAEALAAAILILDDLDMLQNGSNEHIKRSAVERLKQRASALAVWIESAHLVDRRDWGLDFFGGGAVDNLIPHTATTLNVLPEHDR